MKNHIRRRGTHEKFTAAVNKGTMMTNEEARVAFRYHFSLRLMEKLPAKCLCGHKVSRKRIIPPSLQEGQRRADRSP
jgi:hypothetical protein